MGKRTTHCPKGHSYDKANTRYSRHNRVYADGTPYVQITKHCNKCNNDRTKKRREANIEASRKYERDNARARHAILRDEVHKAYGGICNCCQESTPEFLHLDHVNDDGADHRREIGSAGNAILRWAKKNNYPEKLQLLCYNCGLSKKNFGKCPHERTKDNGE